MGSRIVSLQASNVKRLVAVEITPGEDGCVLIGGKNGAGKSSVLDAIMFALGGAGVIQEEPLRRGQKSGSVRLDLGDIIVERRFTANGSTVKVSTPEGAAYSSPQKVLDALFCRLSFDPLAFAQMKPAEQSATLRELMGIDTAAIDAERADAFAERTTVNRRVKQAEARLAAVPVPKQMPGERPDVDSLVQQIGIALKDKASILQLQAERDEIDRDVERLMDRLIEVGAAGDRTEANETELRELQERQAGALAAVLERHRREIEELTANYEEAATSLQRRHEVDAKKREAECRAVQEQYDAAVERQAGQMEIAPIPDVDALQLQLSTAQQTAELWAQAEKYRELAAELKQAKDEAERLTKKIENCDLGKRELLSKVEYPIDGLGVAEDGGVLFEGIPFSQASRAQQIRTSVAMGLQMNPELRVLLIRDGSMLDDDGLALVAEMAKDRDAQIWVERVGNRDEAAIIIEDGMVQASNGAALSVA